MLKNSLQKQAIENPRLVGLFMLTLGGILLYLGFFSALIDIQRHSPVVSYSHGGTLIGIVTVLFGLFLLITGPRYAYTIFTQTEGLRDRMGKRNYYIVLGTFALIAMIFYVMMDHYIGSLGYITP